MTNQTLPTEQLIVVSTIVSAHLGGDLNLLAPYTEQGYTLVRFEVLDAQNVLLHIKIMV
jgi:hypothetical protein